MLSFSYSKHGRVSDKRQAYCQLTVILVQRRIEDRIRRLCAELLEERDHLQMHNLSGQLRSQLHTYVEALRRQFAVYPGVQAHRRKTDAAPMRLPCLTFPKPEVSVDASGDKNGTSEMKAS